MLPRLPGEPDESGPPGGDRPQPRPASDRTLLWALIIGFTFVLLLLGFSDWDAYRYMEPARQGRAKADVQALDKACKTYHAQYDRYPADLGEVVPLLEGSGQGVIDPWGNPYQYRPPADDRSPDPPLIYTVSPKDGTRISNER